MAIDDVIQLTIDRNTRVPTQEGFGTPIICAAHSVTGNTLDVYASTQEISDAGFAATSSVAKAASKLFAQTPRPPRVVIGKRLNPSVQTVQLIPKKLTQGYHYKFAYVDASNLSTTIDYAVPGAATVASICTALAALLNPLADSTATASATEVTLLGVAGIFFDLTGLPNPDDMGVKDTTPDPGLTADLNAIEAATTIPTSWYMMFLDHCGKAETVALAAWMETRKRMAIADVHDSEVFDPAITNDVMSTLKTSSYVRTPTLALSNQLQAYQAAAWGGKVLPKQPGKENWAFKTLTGIPIDVLKGIQSSTVDAKNGNTYESIKGVGVTMFGHVPGSDWIDVIRFVDFLYARLQEELFALELANDKIPFTDVGGAMIKAVILNRLNRCADPRDPEGGGLTNDPAPVVRVPKVKDISTIDKGARTFTGIEFDAYLAGAVNKIKITGKVSL